MPPCIGNSKSAPLASGPGSWEAAASAAVVHESMERFRKGLAPLTLPRSPPGASPDKKLRNYRFSKDVPRKLGTIIPTRQEMEAQARAIERANAANNKVRFSIELGVSASAAAAAVKRSAERTALTAVAAVAASPLAEGSNFGVGLQPGRRMATPSDAVPCSESGGPDDLIAESVPRGAYFSVHDAHIVGDADTNAYDACDRSMLITRPNWRARVQRVAWLRWRTVLSFSPNSARQRRSASARAREAIGYTAPIGAETMAQMVAQSVVAAIARPLALEISAFRAAAEASRINNEDRIAQLAERLESAMAEIWEERGKQRVPRPPAMQRVNSLLARLQRAQHKRTLSDDAGACEPRRLREDARTFSADNCTVTGVGRRLSAPGSLANAYANGAARPKVSAVRDPILPRRW